MSLSNYSENNLLKVLKNEAPSKAAEVFVKLHIGDPGEEGTANAAAETTRKKVELGSISGGVVKNTNVIEWEGVSTTETITHVSLWDASTAGNCLWSGALSGSKALTSGQDARIKAEALSVSLD